MSNAEANAAYRREYEAKHLIPKLREGAEIMKAIQDEGYTGREQVKEWEKWARQFIKDWEEGSTSE